MQIPNGGKRPPFPTPTKPREDWEQICLPPPIDGFEVPDIGNKPFPDRIKLEDILVGPKIQLPPNLPSGRGIESSLHPSIMNFSGGQAGYLA